MPGRYRAFRGGAPAEAFHDFMVQAVANRPPEPFEIEVKMPDWETEPDDEAWYQSPDNAQFVDPDGNPIERPGDSAVGGAPAAPREDERDRLDQEWIDRVSGRGRPPPREETSEPAPDPVEQVALTS